jgi:hypothetical protein
LSDPVNVVFHSPSRCEVSPLVYLHWGALTILEDLEAALPRLRTGDVAYACARFIGYCHTQIEGMNSLGVSNLWWPGLQEGEEFTEVYKRVIGALADDSELVRVNVDTWVVEQGPNVLKQLPVDKAGDPSGFGRRSG